MSAEVSRLEEEKLAEKKKSEQWEARFRRMERSHHMRRLCDDVKIALFSGNVLYIEELLKQGFDPEMRLVSTIEPEDTDSYSTALVEAALHGSVEAIRLLVKNGAMVDSCDSESLTPFAVACYHFRLEAARELRSLGANVNTQSELSGSTPLHRAVRGTFSEREAIINFLISEGADIEARNKDGFTPLLSAVNDTFDDSALYSSGSSSNDELSGKVGMKLVLLRALLRARPNLEARDLAGWTALITASYNGQAALVDFLLDAGADIDGVDNDGCSALMSASALCSLDTVRTLVRRGANVGAKHKFGLMAIDIMWTNRTRGCYSRLSPENQAALIEVLMPNEAYVASIGIECMVRKSFRLPTEGQRGPILFF